jgi:hypothetical protein
LNYSAARRRRHDAQSPAQINLSSVSPVFQVRMNSCQQLVPFSRLGTFGVPQLFTALRPAVLGRALQTVVLRLSGATAVFEDVSDTVRAVGTAPWCYAGPICTMPVPLYSRLHATAPHYEHVWESGVVPLYAITAYRGSRGIAPPVPNFCPGRR